MNPFWFAFFISGVLAYPTLLVLRKLKSGSMISQFAPEAHQQKEGTPNMGGLFVVVAIALVLILFPVRDSQLLLGILFGFFIIGLLDDFVIPRTTGKRGLGWIPKLFLEIGVSCLVFLVHPFNFESSAIAFLILASANAVNFADGLDALATCLLGIALLPFLIFFGVENVTFGVLILGIIGALIPFLFLNSPPARLFMGDTGALPLGAIFGYVFASSPWQIEVWPWFAALIIILELALVPIQLAAVKTLKRRVFPATPIHHAFEVRGWPESRVFWLFVLAQIIFSVFDISLIEK